MRPRAGRIIDQLKIKLFGPCGNGVVVPFIGWQEKLRLLFFDAGFFHGGIVFQQVTGELLSGDEQAIPFHPIAI